MGVLLPSLSSSLVHRLGLGSLGLQSTYLQTRVSIDPAYAIQEFRLTNKHPTDLTPLHITLRGPSSLRPSPATARINPILRRSRLISPKYHQTSSLVLLSLLSAGPQLTSSERECSCLGGESHVLGDSRCGGYGGTVEVFPFAGFGNEV